MKTGQAKDQSKLETMMTETKRMQTAMNDLRSQISDLEGRNTLLEKQYNDLLRQHEEVCTSSFSVLILFRYVSSYAVKLRVVRISELDLRRIGDYILT